MQNILIIEDDVEIAELERDYLEAYGFNADLETNGETGLRKALEGNYNLIVLDLMLAGMDGFEICRRLRQKLDIPVIIISARRTDIDKIRGFGLGADDYMTKPFSPSEMVARVKAHLSRYESLKGISQRKTDCLEAGNLKVDVAAHRVFLRGKELKFPHREFELLTFFMRHPGQVFSHEHLFESIWGLDALGDEATVAVHINRVRSKIEDDLAHPHYIETIRGAGYRFNK